MKRELKEFWLQRGKPLHRVSTIVPMKRELKVLHNQRVDHRAHFASTIVPMKRELKGGLRALNPSFWLDSNEESEILSR